MMNYTLSNAFNSITYHSDKKGPSGGTWHITSGGNKSYYQCKTYHCGQDTSPTAWIIIIIAIAVWSLKVHAASNASGNNKKKILKNYNHKIKKTTHASKQDVLDYAKARNIKQDE